MVIHVIETDGPGGAETIMSELARLSSPFGHRTLAVVPSATGWLGRALPVAIQRIIQPTPPRRASLIDFAYLQALRQLFRKERPSVVHAHSFDSGLYCALALRGLPTSLVTTFHGATDVIRTGFRNRIKWAALNRADVVVCVSDSLNELARSTNRIRAARIRTIHNGVDFQRISEHRSRVLREQLKLDDDTVLLGALGNIRSPKGYDFLLQAIAQLRARGHQVHLAIAGDDQGALADELRAQREILGLTEHVTLLGYQGEPSQFLEGVDLFVLSSTTEGFSLATVQAMAAGLPIVATRSGGPEELLVHDVHGWMVPPGSADALTSGIAALLSDRPRRARLATAARKRALETFSVETMVSRYDALYREVVRS